MERPSQSPGYIQVEVGLKLREHMPLFRAYWERKPRMRAPDKVFSPNLGMTRHGIRFMAAIQVPNLLILLPDMNLATKLFLLGVFAHLSFFAPIWQFPLFGALLVMVLGYHMRQDASDIPTVWNDEIHDDGLTTLEGTNRTLKFLLEIQNAIDFMASTIERYRNKLTFNPSRQH